MGRPPVDPLAHGVTRFTAVPCRGQPAIVTAASVISYGATIWWRCSHSTCGGASLLLSKHSSRLVAVNELVRGDHVFPIDSCRRLLAKRCKSIVHIHGDSLLFDVSAQRLHFLQVEPERGRQFRRLAARLRGQFLRSGPIQNTNAPAVISPCQTLCCCSRT